MNKKSVQEVSKQKVGKTDARYWKTKIYRNSFTKNGVRSLTTDFCIKLAHAGRRETINLRTSNAEAAAARARDIYRTVIASGWDAALAAFRPKAEVPEPVNTTTIGDLITVANQRAVHVRATTMRYYQGCLRQIAASIAGLEQPADRHDYVNGGSARWREAVESLPLASLAPDALRQWQTAYVKNRGAEPAAIRSAKISANSIMGNAARLFTPDMLAHYSDAGLSVPGNPFAGIQPFPRQDTRYFSRIDPVAVLAAARRELDVSAPALPDGLTGVALRNAQLAIGDGPQIYRVILLGTMTGLRRSELDRLQWSHINIQAQTLSVLSTEDGDVKAAGSTRDIDLSPDMVAALLEWKKSARSLYVIECPQIGGRAATPTATRSYRSYRCARVFDKAADWLREHFMPGENHPLHTLRKEFGSLITQNAGIHAAAELLGHRDIRTASEYYVVRKGRALTGLAVPGSEPDSAKNTGRLPAVNEAAD